MAAGVGYLCDEAFRDHAATGPHPESPERLRAIDDATRQAGLEVRTTALPARPATDEELLRVHTRGHVNAITGTEGRRGNLDADTFHSEGSHRAARLAAGGTVDACMAALNGEVSNAFCAVRPPGHHARPDRAMGFCLFNNVAVAAAALLAAGLKRVAILDYDVHHGNGTEEAFLAEPGVLYISLHQHPLFPGTGDAGETGRGVAAGLNVNLPLSPGSGSGEYSYCFETVIEPAARRYQPEFTLISAGFDADRRDPLGNMALAPGDFAWMTAEAAAWAPPGRTVAVLEGGYDLAALGDGATAAITALLGESRVVRPTAMPNETADGTTRALAKAAGG